MKLKDYQVKLHVNPHASPVTEPVRRIPFSFRHKVKKKIDKLMVIDIIEPVDDPTIAPAM